MAKVCTKNAREILYQKDNPYNFFIPTYQRGYRWTEKQVSELLKDLYYFDNKNSSYCLQPIFVKKITIKNQDCFEVVDGQQRITTLWLFTMMKQIEEEARTNKSFFSNLEYLTLKLNYEKKERFQDLINSFNKESLEDYNKNNIDSVSLINACMKVGKTILIDNGNPIGYYDILRAINNKLANIFFIWYELDEGEDPIKVFTNINAGKIPLTNSELIKAKLLSCFSPDSPKRSEIALQWEEIEKDLNDDNFWKFINNENPATRIDFLFDICRSIKIEQQQDRQQQDKKDDYELFTFFEQEFNNKNGKNENDKDYPPTAIWDKIREIHNVLKYWNSKYRLYHLIGLYLYLKEEKTNKAITELYSLYNDITKSEFEAKIIKKLKDILFSEKYFEKKQKDKKEFKNYLEDLNYNVNSDEIKKILLFYNICSYLKSANKDDWFPFRILKDPKISFTIEHVNPQTPDDGKEQEKLDFLKGYVPAFEAKKIAARREKVKFEEYKKILEELKKRIKQKDLEFQDKDYKNYCSNLNEALNITIHNIGNLTLLDKSTNSVYKNSSFIDKREIIVKIIRGIKDSKTKNCLKYILPSTKWIFLKSIPDLNTSMVWDADSQETYVADIIDTIYTILEPEVK
jgi:uncharacterized protein with ParB-like and HNH nuclease domain